jgi:hypothetical protein
LAAAASDGHGLGRHGSASHVLDPASHAPDPAMAVGLGPCAWLAKDAGPRPRKDAGGGADLEAGATDLGLGRPDPTADHPETPEIKGK